MMEVETMAMDGEDYSEKEGDNGDKDDDKNDKDRDDGKHKLTKTGWRRQKMAMIND